LGHNSILRSFQKDVITNLLNNWMFGIIVIWIYK
jgi:hypothetical protein